MERPEAAAYRGVVTVVLDPDVADQMLGGTASLEAIPNARNGVRNTDSTVRMGVVGERRGQRDPVLVVEAGRIANRLSAMATRSVFDMSGSRDLLVCGVVSGDVAVHESLADRCTRTRVTVSERVGGGVADRVQTVDDGAVLTQYPATLIRAQATQVPRSLSVIFTAKYGPWSSGRRFGFGSTVGSP